MLNRIIFLHVLIMANLCEIFCQKLPIWNETTIKNILKPNTDAINFTHYFATWCKPCMEELPVFDSLSLSNSNKAVMFTFICMDFNNTWKLGKVIAKLKLPGKVYYLNPTYHSFESISSSWNGSLPCSIIYFKNNKSQVIEGKNNLSIYKKIIEQ